MIAAPPTARMTGRARLGERKAPASSVARDRASGSVGVATAAGAEVEDVVGLKGSAFGIVVVAAGGVVGVERAGIRRERCDSFAPACEACCGFVGVEVPLALLMPGGRGP